MSLSPNAREAEARALALARALVHSCEHGAGWAGREIAVAQTEGAAFAARNPEAANLAAAALRSIETTLGAFALRAGFSELAVVGIEGLAAAILADLAQLSPATPAAAPPTDPASGVADR